MTITKTATGEVFDFDLHQEMALDHLYENPRAGLFLEMSLSKTVVALLYLYDMTYNECAISKTLVISTKNIVQLTWPDEINGWQEVSDFRYSLVHGTIKERTKALNADAEIYLVSVDNLDWLIDQYITQPRSKSGVTKYPRVGSLPFDCIVFDESTLFKNADSKRYKNLRRALDLSDIPYRIALTGTPTANGERNLYAQINLLDDGKRLGNTWGGFVNKYFDTRGNGMIVFEYTPKPGATKEIARIISDIVLSLKAEDVDIELPKVLVKDIELTLSEYDRELYDELEREYVLDFIEGTSVTVKTGADLNNKLLQISSGAIYEDREEGEARVWHELNTVKIDALRDLVDEYPNENFLVIYKFRHELDRIREAFPEAVILPKGKKLKQTFDDWNAGKIKMLILHPASAGHGLNLQSGGGFMVWITPPYDLEHWLQTIARLRRRFGREFVKVFRLLIKGTQDMRVRRVVGTKETAQNFFMNEVKYFKNKYNG